MTKKLGAESPGAEVHGALVRVLRWTSRRANRQRLYGKAAELSRTRCGSLTR